MPPMRIVAELETENAKLKRIVVEREMAIETLREINRRAFP